MSQKVYDIITSKIVEKLEQGTIPWRKPWGSNPAVNWVTQKPYKGINQMLLEPGEYATFKQINEAGGRVNKGAKSHIITFWKLMETKELDDEGKPVKVPLLRY